MEADFGVLRGILLVNGTGRSVQAEAHIFAHLSLLPRRETPSGLAVSRGLKADVACRVGGDTSAVPFNVSWSKTEMPRIDMNPRYCHVLGWLFHVSLKPILKRVFSRCLCPG
jgi:hypothetical protein